MPYFRDLPSLTNVWFCRPPVSCALAAAVACSIASWAARPATLPVEISVKEHGGVPRPLWPVTGGVPLPKGTARDPAELVLKDATGKPVPCQMNTVTRWRDNSVKWLELNFQASLAPGAKAKYSLARGKPLALAAPLKISETADEVLVDTGAMAFTIPKKTGAIVGDDWEVGLPRESLYAARTCRAKAKELSSREGFEATLCGICINACPWTQRYLARILEQADHH